MASSSGRVFTLARRCYSAVASSLPTSSALQNLSNSRQVGHWQGANRGDSRSVWVNLYKQLQREAGKLGQYNHRSFAHSRIRDDFEANRTVTEPEGQDALATIKRQVVIEQLYPHQNTFIEESLVDAKQLAMKECTKCKSNEYANKSLVMLINDTTPLAAYESSATTNQCRSASKKFIDMLKIVACTCGEVFTKTNLPLIDNCGHYVCTSHKNDAKPFECSVKADSNSLFIDKVFEGR
ncbi:hypothetical protein PRIPAC_72508 [Pristionchus pacificus]|uniref:Uncharacterized protein n=1 Tax=Pristionchus pacificus TaxID=54126 RepID=A0A2A6CRZ8_PRIPA|nr:hypothetical protein PRIPAC_72508 [Pristionchus pacificus]|eukprot:PDM80866.1 hypothetical protein PRIPAC_35869 [Pristionchus pacificus]